MPAKIEVTGTWLSAILEAFLQVWLRLSWRIIPPKDHLKRVILVLTMNFLKKDKPSPERLSA